MTYQVYVRSPSPTATATGSATSPASPRGCPTCATSGVDAFWITPFYTSPQHDHGYDVADYRDVDPLFGTLTDADALLARAHDLGLKVIVDLVPNHTSSEHAWFRAALAAAPGSPERARYLFREGRGPDGSEPPNNWKSVFGGEAWTRVPDGQWYLHLFDSSQPDLDWRNPEVGDMFEEVLRFWLDRGVDGFRVDVAHGLVKEESLRDQVVPDERSRRRARWWSGPRRTSRCGTSPRSTTSTAAGTACWRSTTATGCASPRPGPRRPSRWRATCATTRCSSRSTSTGCSPPGPPPRSPRSSRARSKRWPSVQAQPTWVLSNHDVVRHATRYGGGAVGLARARAATLTMLALPGFGLPLPGRGARAGAGRRRAGGPSGPGVPAAEGHPRGVGLGRAATGAGCRSRGPGARPPYAFGPGAGQPWIPQPPDWESLSVEAAGRRRRAPRSRSTGGRWPHGARTRWAPATRSRCWLRTPTSWRCGGAG